MKRVTPVFRDQFGTRKAKGLCTNCGQPHQDINPSSGKRFTRCGVCRVTSREYAHKRYVEFGRKKPQVYKKPGPLSREQGYVLPHVSQRVEIQHDPIAARFRWSQAVSR